MRILRVFPRRTSYTPTDELAVIGLPGLWRPDADEVHVSVTFSWDVPEGYKLLSAWSQFYPVVKIGGPALETRAQSSFTPGMYVKKGITFTSRGCQNFCPWCLVPHREGRLRHIYPVPPGYIINDNNFLQCLPEHRYQVYRMLAQQPKAAEFRGGIDARLVTDEVAAELCSIRIKELFLACDSDQMIPHLQRAAEKLAFLGIERLRCYVMVGYGGENWETAEARLETVYRAGAMPFAQMYRSLAATARTDYAKEWRQLVKRWSRPAAVKAMHRDAEKAETLCAS
jgi:hypothetical protein